MKEQLLKDIKVGFDSLNEKLSEMLSLLTEDKPPITIRTALTRAEVGRKMALFLKEFYIHKQEDIIIGLRLDGLPCRERPADGNNVTMAEFFDTKKKHFLDKYPTAGLQDLDFWTEEFTQWVGDELIAKYANSLINVEYER